MLVAYALGRNGPQRLDLAAEGAVPANAVWVDLLTPTAGEEAAAEAFMGLAVPTLEEAQEIEFSSRFYTEDGGLFMTVPVLAGVHVNQPLLTPLTFVLINGKIATIRYEEFKAFKLFLMRAAKPDVLCGDPAEVFLTLTESIIDRLADVVERIGLEIDNLNRQVFHPPAQGKRRQRRLAALITEIGYGGDLGSKARESLSALERLLQFAGADRAPALAESQRDGRLKLMRRDVQSLADQLTFLSNKATFLLDATLGLISVEQNEVIRVLTVAATVLLPPTLIGTIYGMNFDIMPETHWTWGYPLALGAMVLSAIVPYLFIRRKRWF